MATFTLAPQVGFHVGDTVYAYPSTSTGLVGPTPVATSVVDADSTVTFTGLAASGRYAAAKAQTGPYVYFRVPAAGESEVTSNARVLLWNATDENYDPAEFRTDTSQPREFVGPTDPITIETITGPVYGDRWTPTVEPVE